MNYLSKVFIYPVKICVFLQPLAKIFDFWLRDCKSACCAMCFDLLRISPSTVYTYADECEMLVFVAPLTSAVVISCCVSIRRECIQNAL